MTDFKRGDQVVYVPGHAEGDIHHPDVECGFVTSINDRFVFCRFYRANGSLRTIANSEAVSPYDLVKHKHMDQAAVDAALTRIAREELFGSTTTPQGVVFSGPFR